MFAQGTKSFFRISNTEHPRKLSG